MKMHEKKLKKFKVYKIIANVLFYLVVIAGSIGILVAIGGLIALVSSGVDLATALQSIIDMTNAAIVIPAGAIPYSLIAVLILSVSVVVALSAYLFKTTSKLFGNIVETKTPFHVGTIKRLKNMGIALFVYTGIEAILGSVASSLMVSPFMHESVQVNYSVDLSTILFGVLLLALSEIFEYGASLQKDSESIV